MGMKKGGGGSDYNQPCSWGFFRKEVEQKFSFAIYILLYESLRFRKNTRLCLTLIHGEFYAIFPQIVD
mgnify:CR=1 FL=1